MIYITNIKKILLTIVAFLSFMLVVYISYLIDNLILSKLGSNIFLSVCYLEAIIIIFIFGYTKSKVLYYINRMLFNITMNLLIVLIIMFFSTSIFLLLNTNKIYIFILIFGVMSYIISMTYFFMVSKKSFNLRKEEFDSPYKAKLVFYSDTFAWILSTFTILTIILGSIKVDFVKSKDFWQNTIFLIYPLIQTIIIISISFIGYIFKLNSDFYDL